MSADQDPLDRGLPIPRIEVYQYLGYSIGFTGERSLLWKCEIVNASGEREFGGPWVSEGLGSLNKKRAERDAVTWQRRTAWPIFDLGRQEQHDEPPKG